MSSILMILQLLTNANNGRWNQLSKGSKLLIQERGPACFASPFERTMLESQRAFFVSVIVLGSISPFICADMISLCRSRKI